MLIKNTVFGIDYLDPKLWTWANLFPKLKCAQIFMKFGTQDIFKFLLRTQRILLKC